MASLSSDEHYQNQILPHVSRTFALTIPQLPPALCTPVTNAYLLCRIADTIEDEPALSAPETLAYLNRFSALLGGSGEPGPLAEDLVSRLSERTLATERDLIANMARVLQVTASLGKAQKDAIQRCVELMCYGMPRFQFNASLRGLARASDLDDYCYYVAGVVGEMLTDLFCDYSVDIAGRRPALNALAASFAQGLQMTNILKDVWEDRSRGACWLPQEVFTRHGVDLNTLASQSQDKGFSAGISELVGVAHAHLRNALDYTLLIPAKERGIRRFCLWAIGLAVLTLRRIAHNPGYTAGAQVKIRRSAVNMTLLLTNLAVTNDWVLKRLFARAARGLPLALLPDIRRPRVALMKSENHGDIEPQRTRLRSYGSSGS
ncbi:MAG TPA: phytoene/squalene synthase family protein [Steroidobacteraceae bacterium]|jgi:farnesyl-diphosphate farnesyltransferase|nr:phytoene/squalene synthase family protein [Steroidobacteraceae bacterium]